MLVLVIRVIGCSASLARTCGEKGQKRENNGKIVLERTNLTGETGPPLLTNPSQLFQGFLERVGHLLPVRMGPFSGSQLEA